MNLERKLDTIINALERIENRSNNKSAYTLREMALALGCGMNKSYDLVHSGKVKSFKVGKKFMIPAKSLEDYIETLSN